MTDNSSSLPLHATMAGPQTETQAVSYPWRVDSLPDCGRVLIATRDIAPFELVLADSAVAMTPNDVPVCLGCLGKVTVTLPSSSCQTEV